MTARFGRPGEFGHVKPASAAGSIGELVECHGEVVQRFEDGEYEAVQLADGSIFTWMGRGQWLAVTDERRANPRTRWARFLKELEAA